MLYNAKPPRIFSFYLKNNKEEKRKETKHKKMLRSPLGESDVICSTFSCRRQTSRMKCASCSAKRKTSLKKQAEGCFFLWDSSPAGEPFRGSDSPTCCHSDAVPLRIPRRFHRLKLKRRQKAVLLFLVDLVGFEPMTSALRTRRSPN